MEQADTGAIEKFRYWPKNVGQLRRLLAFVGFYRCYVKDFASNVKPLHDMLKGDSRTNVPKVAGSLKFSAMINKR